MATYSSILACKVPWAEEPGGLQSCSPWGRRELDTTKHAHTHACMPYIGIYVCVCVCVCVCVYE